MLVTIDPFFLESKASSKRTVLFCFIPFQVLLIPLVSVPGNILIKAALVKSLTLVVLPVVFLSKQA